MFRDESEGLSVKRQRLKEASNRKPLPIDSTTRISPTSKAVVLGGSWSSTSPTAIPVLSVNPCFPLEEQATCFFFQNYLLGEDNLATGIFEFLPNVFLTNEINEALSDSLTAVGLAGLAHFYRDPSMMPTAVYKYNSAMRTLSSQLRDMEDAKSDQMFIAIMLLGLYEVSLSSFRGSGCVYGQSVGQYLQQPTVYGNMDEAYERCYRPDATARQATAPNAARLLSFQTTENSGGE